MSAYAVDMARTLKPGSAERNARALELFRRFLAESRRPNNLAVLTRQTMAEFFSWLSLARTGLHGQQREVITVVKVTRCVEVFWRWVHDSDLAPVALPKRLKMPSKQQAETDAPTWDEMDACIAACETAWHRQLATVMRFTGLRCNQAMRLLWSDVDLERAELRVRPELGKTAQEARGRTIPISARLVAELAGWGVREGHLITTNRVGQRERQARDRDMARAWVRAGVRAAAWEGRPHHAFRKGFVTGLRHLGADADAVEFLVGHSLGLKGTYTAARGLSLRTVVELIPPMGEFPKTEPGRNKAGVGK